KQVKDPELRKKLTPRYKIGCKRILKSDDYYPVFNQSHVSLVTDPIEQFLPDGILAGGKTYQVDAAILATGFVAADIELRVKIIGLDGGDLVEKWKIKGAEAYLGTTVAGYPNLAFILGPNTGLGSNSVVHMMESQMRYIMQYIACLEQAGTGSYLDLQEAVQESYNRNLQKDFKGTVWNAGCKSWYINRAGKNTTIFPRLSVRFRKLTRVFDVSKYRLVKQKQASPERVL
ncbi:MAG: NAD(P)/FAD-dependent oxidoreductase, partial [Williamsia sp.]|nr:NAD(P)/FAD-dependent oxidoreductase [Williamsia sp.]